MSELTFIKGKDACLEDSINGLQSALTQQGFAIAEKSWLNPVPNVFSLHIAETSCPGIFTNGKGVSRKSTLASALGEFAERLSTNYFFSDYWLQPAVEEYDWLYYPHEKQFTEHNYRECLSPALWDLYDKEQEIGFNELLSFNDDKESVTALPLTEVSSGKTVYFPMNLLSNYYASNGLSAGNTALEAQVQGLSEIFERWVKNKILRENLCLPEVPNAVVKRFPAIEQAIEGLLKEGITVSVRDASLGGKFPVISVILFEQATGRCFASFGAHPIFEVALERTVTESLQGRQLARLDGFQTPVFDEFSVAEDENIENHFIDSSGLIHARFISQDADFEFVEWDFGDSTAEQWQALLAMVHAEGAEVYLANYIHCGFNACRIVVPGMSEIYPFDELLQSNQNEGRLLREALIQLPTKQDYLSLVDLIDALGFSDHQGVASLIGLMPDKESFWAHVKICDLRFWALLAAQEFAEALEAINEVNYFMNPNNPYKLLYDALSYALQQKDYCQQNCQAFDLQGVQALFGEQICKSVEQLLSAELVFAGEPLGLAIFEGSQQHQALWKIYKTLHANKQQAFAV